MKKILVAAALLSFGTAIVNAMNEQSDPAKRVAMMERMRQERREAHTAAKQAALAQPVVPSVYPQPAMPSETPADTGFQVRARERLRDWRRAQNRISTQTTMPREQS